MNPRYRIRENGRAALSAYEGQNGTYRAVSVRLGTRWLTASLDRIHQLGSEGITATVGVSSRARILVQLRRPRWAGGRT